MSEFFRISRKASMIFIREQWLGGSLCGAQIPKRVPGYILIFFLEYNKNFLLNFKIVLGYRNGSRLFFFIKSYFFNIYNRYKKDFLFHLYI
jgi:hypothetical protein